MEKLDAGKFDFIEAVVMAYKFVWAKRIVFLQLGFIPFLIKSVLFLLVVMFSLHDNYLRAGLILIPSYAAEGWLISQAIRLVLLVQARDFPNAPFLALSSPEAAVHRQTLLASVILYTLIKLAVAFLVGLMVYSRSVDVGPQTPTAEIPTLAAAFIGIGFVFITFWVFRYVWVYVPMAMGYAVKSYVTAVRHFITSFYMLALWMMCFVPVILALLLVSELFLQIFPPLDPQTPAPAFTYVMVFFQSAAEIVIALISSVAMTYGIYTLMNPAERRKIQT